MREEVCVSRHGEAQLIPDKRTKKPEKDPLAPRIPFGPVAIFSAFMLSFAWTWLANHGYLPNNGVFPY